MNKKGFATIGIMMAVLFVSMVLIGTFFNPIFHTAANVQDSKDLTPAYINNMNGLERLHANLTENPSLTGDVKFQDINKVYKVTQIAEDYTVVRQPIRGTGKFSVNNKSYLNVEFKVESSNPAYSYDIEIKLNGKVIVKDTGLKNNTLIEMGEDYLYNEATGETKYGDFEVNILQNGAKIVANVEYRNLDYREVQVSTDDFNRTVIIDRKGPTSSVYFK